MHLPHRPPHCALFVGGFLATHTQLTARPATPSSFLQVRNATSGFLGATGFTGVLLTLPLPVTPSGANRACTLYSGTGPAVGDVQRSSDGAFLTLGCFGCAVGSTAATAGCPRVAARVSAAGAIDTTTALTDWAPAGFPASVFTVDGSAYYLSGSAGGIRYALHGATTSVALHAAAAITYAHRVLVAFGELFASAHFSSPSGSRGVVRIGLGAAPTAASATNGALVLPGYMVTPQNTQQLSCVGFEFTTPTRLTAACDTIVDGLDFYSYTRAGGAGVGSPGSSTWTMPGGAPAMQTRWSGSVILYGVRLLPRASRKRTGQLAHRNAARLHPTPHPALHLEPYPTDHALRRGAGRGRVRHALAHRAWGLPHGHGGTQHNRAEWLHGLLRDELVLLGQL